MVSGGDQGLQEGSFQLCHGISEDHVVSCAFRGSQKTSAGYHFMKAPHRASDASGIETNPGIISS